MTTIPVIDCCGLVGWSIPWADWFARGIVCNRDSTGHPIRIENGTLWVYLSSIAAQPSQDAYEWFAGYVIRLPWWATSVIIVDIDPYIDFETLTVPDWQPVLDDILKAWNRCQK